MVLRWVAASVLDAPMAAASSRGRRGRTARHTGSSASSRPGVASTIKGQWLASPTPQATAAAQSGQPLP